MVNTCMSHVQCTMCDYGWSHIFCVPLFLLYCSCVPLFLSKLCRNFSAINIILSAFDSMHSLLCGDKSHNMLLHFVSCVCSQSTYSRFSECEKCIVYPHFVFLLHSFCKSHLYFCADCRVLFSISSFGQRVLLSSLLLLILLCIQFAFRSIAFA